MMHKIDICQESSFDAIIIVCVLYFRFVRMFNLVFLYFGNLTSSAFNSNSEQFKFLKESKQFEFQFVFVSYPNQTNPIQVKYIFSNRNSYLSSAMQKQYEIKSFPNKYANICFICASKQSKVTLVKLKRNIESIIESSFNPVLTLASFIVYSIKDLKPPGLNYDKETNGAFDTVYPSQSLSVNGYFEPWCEFISGLVIEGKATERGEEIYFLELVDSTYLEKLNNHDAFQIIQKDIQNVQTLLEEKNYPELLLRCFDLAPLEEKSYRRKYAIVSFSASVTQKDIYHPRIHMRGLMFGTFFRNGDQWKSYYILKGEVPSQEQIECLDGIILSGSSNSVNDQIPSVQQFMTNLVKAYMNTKDLKILGLCFGHQAIAKYMGGNVIKIPKRIIGLQSVKFNLDKIKQLGLDYLDKLSESGVYRVSQFHGDSVQKIPQGFEIIASSKTCENEVMASLNKRILSYQFHMEYTPQYAKSYEVRLKSYRPDYEHGKIFAGASQVLSSQENVNSVLQLRQISRNFLDFIIKE